MRFIDPDGMAPKNCCPTSSQSVFYSEMQKKLGFIQTAVENFFGSSTKSSISNSGNTQPVGYVLESPDGVGPMDTGTKGDQIGAIINADLPIVKSPPSGGFMEKIANALGVILEGLLEISQPVGQDTNNETEPTTSKSETKSDPTFFDVKTDHNGMGFSIEYKKIEDNGDTTHVKGITNGYKEANKALESVKKNQ